MVTLIIDGSPFWGSDGRWRAHDGAGGGNHGLLLLGWQIRRSWLMLFEVWKRRWGFSWPASWTWRSPRRSRTHLGRLFEDIGDNGFGAVRDPVVVRKFGANLAVLGSSEWTPMLPVVLRVHPPPRVAGALAPGAHPHPAAGGGRLGLPASSWRAGLGFALNDSGIAIPGLMLGVMNASLVYLVMKTRETEPSEPAPSKPSA